MVRLAPGGVHRASVTLEILDGADAVRAVEEEAARLACGRVPAVHERPQPGYAEAG